MSVKEQPNNNRIFFLVQVFQIEIVFKGLLNYYNLNKIPSVNSINVTNMEMKNRIRYIFRIMVFRRIVI